MIPILPRNSMQLYGWCALYQEGGTVPQPRNIRFCIAVYQISQGMSWKIASPVRWQSFCAAAMHFMMCASAYDIRIHDDMPEELEDISEDFRGWEQLLLSLGKAQQQIMYGLQSSASSTRASRFNCDVLRMRLYELITGCFSLCPPGHRAQCCQDEMLILCRDLPKATPSNVETVRSVLYPTG